MSFLPTLLEQSRAALRSRHYALRTERSYLDWISRFVRFHKTIEIIVEEEAWEPPVVTDELVALRIGASEYGLHKRLRDAHGHWKPAQKVWVLLASQAAALGLSDRIIGPYADLSD